MSETLFELGPAAKKPSKRREKDRYLTPPMATNALMEAYPQICGDLLIDPCCGDGRMAAQLFDRFGRFIGNDIDRRASEAVDYCLDATQPATWACWRRRHGVGFVVTNPPFNRAADIAWQALEHGNHLALLLRITWLEPVKERQWLARRPPTAMLVLPRVDFIGAGETDGATCAWMIWGPVQPGIKVVRAEDVGQLSLGAA